MLLESAFR